jgi:hypothetical protein
MGVGPVRQGRRTPIRVLLNEEAQREGKPVPGRSEIARLYRSNPVSFLKTPVYF